MFTVVDRSGAIAAGNVSQQMMAANAGRMLLFVQNISADTLWINFGIAAVQDQPSVRLHPGIAWSSEGGTTPTLAVHVIGPNLGAKFVAKEG